MCPLKDAARDTPHQLALISPNRSLTFAQLDHYVDQIPISTPIIHIPATPTLHTIALIFAAWRVSATIFPYNPKLPTPPQISSAPPHSLLLYTSGSTATPKIAILSLENLLISASTAIPALDLRPQDQWLLTLPLFHVGGIGILIRCILARATIVLGDSPHITHLSYVPTHIYRASPVYKTLRCLLLGGAPISNIPNYLPIYTTYGLTEMSSLVTLNGHLLPSREMKLAPDGEILVRGPTLFQGYLNAPPPPDWFPTGDLGCIQNNQWIIKGRKDWMFISGGENIQPEEIERHLLTIPNILEAVVVPKNDPEFGKRPVAFIRAHGKVDFKQIQSVLSEHLPKFKLPISYHLIDAFPQKNNLKVDRIILSQYANKQ